MNIILIGFKSCGKSTVGAALAQQLALTFVDTDRLLEQKHTANTGETRSFREIYRQYGQDYFFTLEQQIVTDLTMCDGYVIASGGRTLLDHPLPAPLRSISTIVYLDATPEILLARINAGEKPAFFGEHDFETSFRQLYQDRKPRYQQLADTSVPVDQHSVQDIVEQIIKIIKAQRDRMLITDG